MPRCAAQACCASLARTCQQPRLPHLVQHDCRGRAYKSYTEAFESRAYRLHNSRSQERCDLLAQAGMALGGAAAVYFLPASAAAVVAGSAAGAGAGVFAHMLSRPAAEMKTGWLAFLS